MLLRYNRAFLTEQRENMSLQQIIETAFENRTQITPATVSPEVKDAVQETIARLDSGSLRVAQRRGVGDWQVNEWVKKAVLLSFRIADNEVLNDGVNQYFDKVPTKFAHWTQADFQAAGFRAVPGAIARRGSFIAKNAVLMPSYVNIGKNVHLSGGVGIGGVLEPLQAAPTIIEDNCFIGARSEIVEGVIVEEGSVISMGVFIGQSTKIYDRTTGEIHYGRVPAGSVVVSGSLPSKDGSHSLYCAVIVKKVDAKTRSKTSINDLLRGV